MASTVATLLASLENAAHAWVVRGRHTHVNSHQVIAGAGVDLTVSTHEHETRTYQLYSAPLSVHVIVVAYLEAGSLDRLDAIWHGTNFDVTDSAIFAAIEALAAAGIAAAAADLTARLTTA
jgi:hypothetical protein